MLAIDYCIDWEMTRRARDCSGAAHQRQDGRDPSRPHQRKIEFEERSPGHTVCRAMVGRPDGLMATKPNHQNAKRVLLVDDHPVWRKGLVRLIDSNHEFLVCGEASTARHAMALIRKLGPDLVIVDIGLPGTS